MVKCFAICLPKCVGGKGKKGVSDSDGPRTKDDDRNHVHRKLTQYFKESELVVLGDLSTRVRVVIDSSLPDTLHGTSRVTLGVPLAVVNPRAPDRRYVILHELMHHQLDELGCPSLCCTVKGTEPQSSWLRHTKFQSFVRGLLVQLWELVQHSRFNLMLKRIFNCGPESARDGEYRRYIKHTALPMYGMCGQNGHGSVRKVAVSAHVATTMLEASPAVQEEFKKFVRSRFAHGEDMIAMGEKLYSYVRSIDVELLKCSREELDKIISEMLVDLQKMLTELDTGMKVVISAVKPLKEKFNGRCTTVAEVDFCTPHPGVSVNAGGFGGASFGEAAQRASAEGQASAGGGSFGHAGESVMIGGCSCGCGAAACPLVEIVDEGCCRGGACGVRC